MDNIESLLKLKQENPELEIVPMVNTNVVAGDEHAWWIAKFGKASIEEIWIDNQRETVYIRSKDEDDLIDEVAFDLDPEMGEQEAYEDARGIVDSYDWKKVIAVSIYV